jgi:hypothetical protein
MINCCGSSLTCTVFSNLPGHCLPAFASEAEVDKGDDQSENKSTVEKQKLSWLPLLEGGVVQGLVHVLKVSVNDTVKQLAFRTLFNLLGHAEVR